MEEIFKTFQNMNWYQQLFMVLIFSCAFIIGLYTLIRLASSALFRSYFEGKLEFLNKTKKHKNQKEGGKHDDSIR
jgi:hypothetical protein